MGVGGSVPTLHIHLDEAGNFDFSPKGSKYYVFTVSWTYEPAAVAHELEAVRYGLLKRGVDLQRFHACEDKHSTRSAVLSILKGGPTWNFASVVVQKNKVYQCLRDPGRFYPQFASYPLKFVLRGRVRPGTTGVLIYTDTIPVEKNRRAVEKAVKTECAADLPRNLPCHMYHHTSASNLWLQATDYACWAVQRKWEQGDLGPYTEVQPRIAYTELDVLARGTQTFY